MTITSQKRLENLPQSCRFAGKSMAHTASASNGTTKGPTAHQMYAGIKAGQIDDVEGLSIEETRPTKSQASPKNVASWQNLDRDNCSTNWDLSSVTYARMTHTRVKSIARL
jgi:hypothetical protein